MAIQRSNTYPFGELGGMYVHTNYYSFQTNLGSFGNYSGILESNMNTYISQQESRERDISDKIKDTYGITIYDIVKWFQNPSDYTKHHSRIVTDSWNDKTTTKNQLGIITGSGKTFGDYTKALHVNHEDATAILQRVLDGQKEAYDKLATSYGTITQNSLQEGINYSQHLINEFKSKVGDNSDAKKDTVKGGVNNVKGYIFENVIGNLLMKCLQSIGKNSKNIEITRQGTGNVADAVINFDKVEIGVNIKSTSMKTFIVYGVNIFSGSTIKNIADLIEGEGNVPFGTAELFKYYIINTSRMLGKDLTGQSGSGGLGHKRDGSQFIRDVLATYATIFIGSDSSSTRGADDKIKQADIFILKDMIYLKSTLLKELKSKDIGAFLKITYDYGSQSEWDTFDYRKRFTMFNMQGDYGRMLSQTNFVQSMAEKLASQTANVKLQLFNATTRSSRF